MGNFEKTQGTKWRNEYRRNNYDRYSLMLAKGKKQIYMALAEQNGMKFNELINSLLESELAKEDAKND